MPTKAVARALVKTKTETNKSAFPGATTVLVPERRQELVSTDTRWRKKEQGNLQETKDVQNAENDPFLRSLLGAKAANPMEKELVHREEARRSRTQNSSAKIARKVSAQTAKTARTITTVFACP